MATLGEEKTQFKVITLNQESQIEEPQPPEKKKKVIKRGKKRSWQRLVVGILIFVALVAIITGLYLFLRKVRDKVYIEAGTKMIEASVFLYHQSDEAYFLTDMKSIDLSVPSEYTIELQLQGKDKVYQSTLIIQDTTPPAADPVEKQIGPGTQLEPNEFVDNIHDATDVQCTFKKMPDFEKIGVQEVTIILEDGAGNTATVQTTLTISRVRTRLYIEAGTKEGLSIEDFLLADSVDAEILTDISSISFDKPGSCDIRIRDGEDTYSCKLEIVDTMAPQGSLREGLILWQGVGVEAEDLVENVQDASNVTIYFIDGQGPDVNAVGRQTVSIVLKDEYGNSTLLKAEIEVQADTEPPQIYGVLDRSVYLEEKIAYKKDVYVEDNSGQEIEVEVDSSQVDITKTGKYTVTYTATDASGNTSTAQATFTVTEKPADAVTEDDVYTEADKVLAEIINDSMSDKEKAKAAYDWCRANIAYVNHSDKSNWLIGAYQAFTQKSGDCFNYFAAGKAMLERIGIENIDVVKTGGGHYWSMINLGDGWYHFDPTPRTGSGDNFFMVTDAFLETYSAKHSNSHVWDRDAYPATPAE